MKRTAFSLIIVAVAIACGGRSAAPPSYKTFATPEAAVQALEDAAQQSDISAILALFGPEAKDLASSSDAATARSNREVVLAAMAERWRLEDQPNGSKWLVVGNEDWPFPVPLVKDANGWRFDTAAGREEVLARRIGRNELAVIRVCRTYVAAQELYARRGHDGAPAGVFAAKFASDPGRQNGLYWQARPGEKPSPLGDLVAAAAQEGRPLNVTGDKPPSPFHGYYFKILTRQGTNVPGGAKDYVVGGRMSGGFALVAWPAQYDGSGIMTFVVGPDGVVYQKDLGPDTSAAAAAIAAYDPDSTWTAAR